MSFCVVENLSQPLLILIIQEYGLWAGLSCMLVQDSARWTAHKSQHNARMMKDEGCPVPCLIFSAFCYGLLLPSQCYTITDQMLLCYLHSFLNNQDFDVKQAMVLTSVLNQSSKQTSFQISVISLLLLIINYYISGIFYTWKGLRKYVITFKLQSFIRRKHLNSHGRCIQVLSYHGNLNFWAFQSIRMNKALNTIAFML
jgi:hypothetical protein